MARCTNSPRHCGCAECVELASACATELVLDGMREDRERRERKREKRAAKRAAKGDG